MLGTCFWNFDNSSHIMYSWLTSHLKVRRAKRCFTVRPRLCEPRLSDPKSSKPFLSERLQMDDLWYLLICGGKRPDLPNIAKNQSHSLALIRLCCNLVLQGRSTILVFEKPLMRGQSMMIILFYMKCLPNIIEKVS